MKNSTVENLKGVVVDGAKALVSIGGTVGRIDYNGHPEIAIRLKYRNPETDNADVTDFYMMSPWAARYAGFHLFRRGVVDGAKLLAKNLLKGVKRHA